MLSKLARTIKHNNNLLQTSQRAFRATAVANKKPSIGDAVTILQSKVSSINQVVSAIFIQVHHAYAMDAGSKSKRINECLGGLEGVRNGHLDW